VQGRGVADLQEYGLQEQMRQSRLQTVRSERVVQHAHGVTAHQVFSGTDS